MMKKMSRLKMKTQGSNFTLPDNSRSSSRMRMSKQMTGIASSLDSLNLKLKRNSKENPKKVDKAKTFQLVQNAMGVKVMGI